MRLAAPCLLLLSCLLAPLAGCAPGRGPSPEAPGTERGAGPPPGPEFPSGRPAVPGRRPEAPEPPRVAWPRGWRLVESGGLGPEARPSFWWTLDAGHEDPARAVDRAREALARRFGAADVPAVPAVRDDTAVGTLVAPGRRAAITARRSEGRTEVRIVLGTGVE